MVPGKERGSKEACCVRVPVYAGAQVLAPCLHAVPCKHTYPLLPTGLTDAGQGLDLAALATLPDIDVLRWCRRVLYQHTP